MERGGSRHSDSVDLSKTWDYLSAMSLRKTALLQISVTKHMPPKRAYAARPVAPEQASSGDSYYGNNPRNPKTVAAQEAAQRLRALRAIVFAGPLLVVSSVSVVFSLLSRNEEWSVSK